jgi:hypothetical protein
MAKRGNGRGAAYLRGDGRLEAQIRLAGGRRKSVYGPTRREVVRRLRETRWLLGPRRASQCAQDVGGPTPGELAGADARADSAQHL